MVVDTDSICINIGDYIQALAASQFFDKIDVYIQREKMNSYQGDPVKMIMNGWYMHHPKNWPPSNRINPLFVSFHINSTVKEQMLSDESVNYLKSHGPIGCRDIYTMNLLKSKGIEAYFSACLTLTLGFKYKFDEERNGKCYFVDPFLGDVWNVKWILRSALYTLFHSKRVFLQKQRMFSVEDSKNIIKQLLKASRFYMMYHKVFDRKILEDAIYINHESEMIKRNYPSDIEKLKYAESLVKKYAQSSLVVTSRIHCALPCLGLNTPVIYLNNSSLGEMSSCRLDGLLDLFTVIDCANNILVPLFQINGKIRSSHDFINNRTYKKYVSRLIKQCQEFVNSSLY